MPKCRMFEAFSRAYYLGRLYVEPYAGDRAVIHRAQHRRVNAQVYGDADEPPAEPEAGTTGTDGPPSAAIPPDDRPVGPDAAPDDRPLVMKLEGTHFTVDPAEDVPHGTLALPDTLLERCNVRNPPTLREVLLARADRAVQLLR